MAVEAGPRSAFEVTYAVLKFDNDTPIAVIDIATEQAIQACLVVSEVVRVAQDVLANGSWYWLVTLRVFPRPPAGADPGPAPRIPPGRSA